MNVFLVLALIASLGSQDQSHATATDTTVLVSVTRTIRVTADRASMYVVAEGVGETPNIALERLTPRMNAVRDTLRRFGPPVIAGKPLPFQVAPIAPQPGYPPQAQNTSYAARAVVRISVTIEDLARVQAAMFAAGASSVTGQTYESTAPDSLWRVAISEAAAEARLAAISLAESHAKRLGPLIDMNAGRSSVYMVPPQIALDPRYQGSLSPPEVPLTATVSVRYRLLPQ